MASGNNSLSFDPNFEVEDDSSKAAAPAVTQTSNGSQSQQSSIQSTSTASEDEARKAKLKAALANVTSWQPEGVPLSQSGAYVPASAPASAPAAHEPQYEEYMDDVDGFSDGDASRDLCSFPCINCGAVPSFAMYELCGKCLDEMSPT